MKSIFAQTAEHSIDGKISPACLNDLPNMIRKHTDWEYACAQTDTGCVLMPTFRNMPYRNSFVPEIDITASHNNGQTVLHMRGQPVVFVRVFMAFWFSFLLMMEINVLAIAITSGLDSIIPAFIPIIMCAFGYFLCKIGTKVTFRSIVKAIQKELK